MHSFYTEAMETTGKLKQARLEVARYAVELTEAEYDLQLAKARIERGLIKSVQGEKALGPTVEDRARIFVLAVDADGGYRAQVKRRNEATLQLEEAKAEAAYLRDRLTILLAALRASDEPSGAASSPAAPLS